MKNLIESAGFEPDVEAALAARPASWECPAPDCEEVMRGRKVPKMEGSRESYVVERTCSPRCYRATMAIETPRKEILRRIGIRPGYVDKLFDHELSDERNARGADWRGWDGSTNVLIVGANGSGKSMLAVEMLLRAWRRGVLSLAMLQLPELMDEHFGDSKGPRTLRDLALRARIAVLDEFGRGRAASVYAAGLAAEIVELRMGFERPTIILSNLPLQGPEASIESLDSALYDRMARGSLIIELAGDSLRGTK